MPGAMFFLVGAFIAAANAWSALRSGRQQGQHQQGEAPSVIPFAGGLMMVAGMLTAPLAALHTFAWVPLFLDYGCLPTIGRALAVALFGRHQPEKLGALGVDADAPSTMDTPAQTSAATPTNDHFDREGASS